MWANYKKPAFLSVIFCICCADTKFEYKKEPTERSSFLYCTDVLGYAVDFDYRLLLAVAMQLVDTLLGLVADGYDLVGLGL